MEEILNTETFDELIRMILEENSTQESAPLQNDELPRNSDNTGRSDSQFNEWFGSGAEYIGLFDPSYITADQLCGADDQTFDIEGQSPGTADESQPFQWHSTNIPNKENLEGTEGPSAQSQVHSTPDIPSQVSLDVSTALRDLQDQLDQLRHTVAETRAYLDELLPWT